jgi:hypothetical protein
VTFIAAVAAFAVAREKSPDTFNSRGVARAMEPVFRNLRLSRFSPVKPIIFLLS